MAESLTIQSLDARFAQVKAQQGFLGKAWNGIKEVTNLGQSLSDCESMLEKYKNNEITLEEAMEYIDSFETKQKDMTNLIANIITGISSIAVATGAIVTAGATGGASIGWLLALKKGAPRGALVKTAIKFLDRATNDIKGDALDGKEILRDLSSGGITGTVSAVSSGIYAGVKTAKLATSLINGCLCGVECGALSGSSNYLIDTVLDKDKKFNFGDLTKTTLTSAFVSGTVGTAVGGGVYGVEKLIGHTGKIFEIVADKGAETITRNSDKVILSTNEAIVRDSALSSSRKILGTVERNIINA